MDQTENHLIGQLPQKLHERFLGSCERFALVPSAKLGSCGDVLTHAYFPISGVIALVVDVQGRPPLEVGAVGKEAMLGSELLLGAVQSPWRAVVEGEGICWRIEAHALNQAMADMPGLQSSLQQNFIVQVHQRQALASASASASAASRQRESQKPLSHCHEAQRDEASWNLGSVSAYAAHRILVFMRGPISRGLSASPPS